MSHGSIERRKKEEGREMRGANTASPISAIEDKLLRSSGGETEGGQESTPMDSTTWETQRTERRKQKKNEARTRKRREERQAKKERRLQGLQAPTATHPEAGSSTAPAPMDDQSGTSTTRDTVQDKGNQAPTKLRGPHARQARRERRREAKRQSFVLPTAPAAVREEGLGGPQGQPDPSTQAAERKRTRGEKTTPPERQRKKSKTD
ncbi:hypothetical protein NQ315_003618 [Exocentrus adspersus]|uniref:Uncharacterized protein n=1 Tax=Exocentrus adspersus TaxID=1586481 RepID=A0AAV8VJ46_9CUCU|nr:hypothetical protein NQ315_003618 [Exocentrus adspersus]